MELREFIKQTLIQISEGIVDAKEATKETGMLINPAHTTTSQTPGGGKFINALGGGSRFVQYIDFDIAVSVSENDSASAGISVLSVIKLGVQGEVESKNNRVTKISFSIPVALPTSS